MAIYVKKPSICVQAWYAVVLISPKTKKEAGPKFTFGRSLNEIDVTRKFNIVSTIIAT